MTDRHTPPTDIEQAIAAMHAADATAREKLPALPPGQEWHSELEVVTTSAGGTLARLVYSIRPHVTELRPRRRE